MDRKIPICATCGRVRNGDGCWVHDPRVIRIDNGGRYCWGIEERLLKKWQAYISHGICDDCFKKDYPKIYHTHKQLEQTRNKTKMNFCYA